MTQPTPFIEANIVLAAQERDYAEAKVLLAQMLPGEKVTLGAACAWIAQRCLSPAAPEITDLAEAIGYVGAERRS
jgi:hypothetical protein